MLGWIYWDPSSEFFKIPYFNLPLTWYGLLFALGFWIGFHIFSAMFKNFLARNGIKNSDVIANAFSEKLLLYVMVATVLGARLGHIIFYEYPLEYLKNPISILKTWEGGLASHGAVFAIIISVFLFAKQIEKEYPEFSFFRLLDYLSVPAMLLASFIRLGNFFNQEILGISTSMPWGIIFGHPADGSPALPRHPAQLYEALVYFSLFFVLGNLWRKKKDLLNAGRLAGVMLTTVFSFRFLIEFLKSDQSLWFDQSASFLLMGQVLSLPAIAYGLYLLFRKSEAKKAVKI
ncbi:MAG: prolipoprotein diacylglyceryl transferase [Chlamydiae bacterium]|jgi:prolipoprotein diacylglyceryl transferase|nr:prolipoprotein diacylglyceryl transferase [Chlamydiota bacterium]